MPEWFHVECCMRQAHNNGNNTWTPDSGPDAGRSTDMENSGKKKVGNLKESATGRKDAMTGLIPYLALYTDTWNVSFFSTSFTVFVHVLSLLSLAVVTESDTAGFPLPSPPHCYGSLPCFFGREKTHEGTAYSSTALSSLVESCRTSYYQ